MSHGYGLSVTPLQLAHAYATIGAFGVVRPVSFLRVEAPPLGERALDEHVCRELIGMLERVVTAEGTGKLAAIPGYRVSGKTGTACKATAGGYSTDRYMAVFGGVAPTSEPRLAAVVVIDEPSAGEHMGGQVAAPVFSRVVGGALRLLAVAPDEPISTPRAAARGTGARQRAHGGTAMSARGLTPARPRALSELAAGLVARAARRHGERSHPRQPRRHPRRAVSRPARPHPPRPRVRRRGGGARRARGAVRSSARMRRRRPGCGADIFVAAVPAPAARAPASSPTASSVRPRSTLTVAGITGTNGKTTCAWLLAQALAHCGRPAALHRHPRLRACRPQLTPTAAHDRAMRSRCSASWRRCARSGARVRRRWRCPRTRSTRRASTACASTPPPSPT